MRPCKNVKYSHVCGQIENTLTSENTVDQRNTNKATVGIYSGKLIDHVIGILFITKQEFGYEDCKDVRDKCGDKRKQKSLYENGIIVGLIDHNDQNRVNKHQQKKGGIKMKRLCGVNPPVITIFDEHHKVDIEASKRQADFLISKGVDGLAYLGTSGEFSIMTVEEKKNFINEMIKYVNGCVNVIVGVGDTCLENTMDLLKFVEQAGADGVLLINPYFSVYSTDMVEAYFGYVASHTSLPIIIYNFPDLTGYCFNADVVARIVKANPNVVGIKDTIADFNHVLSMQKVKEINPDFSVFSAYENQAMGLLVCGVDGFINATANFAPEYTVNTYQSAKRGDFNEAAKWFNKMVEAMDIYAYSTPLFLACKQAMYYRVLHHDGQERLPALSLDATAKANVYNKMRDLELL